eukprot:TRINITY_DN3527_c0_g5_i1.p1 TRINITY_DN3527_c0_g5~~TRINITY_DN3527_c0_g5_i1.p1  ORF type:complete len:892 (-),score=102.07 TRINITY_DN3527_c0_g5_i1:78-2558(-)
MPLPAEGEEPSICERGGGGFLLPLGGDGEQAWPRTLRIVLYFVGLGWSFMGVALLSDVFMGAIESITAERVRRWCDQKQRLVTVSVWNGTVANLTLMALGSSAPEILLSVIELLGNDFFSGDLGPSTIVGSAAFNLFMITAVCVSSVPDGQIRAVNQVGVYILTVFSSLLAYIWLLVILNWWTPDIVTIAEGVLTFMFFIVLVIVAYMIDIGMASSDRSMSTYERELVDEFTSKEVFAELERKIRKENGYALTEEQVAKIIRNHHTPKPSRARYKVAATRAIMGTGKIPLPETTQKCCKVSPLACSVDETGSVEAENHLPNLPIVEFEVEALAVLEGCGTVQVSVCRTGLEQRACKVRYCTRDGAAKAGEDYRHTQGEVNFSANETKQTFEVDIIDDEVFEANEEFYIDLFDPEDKSIELGKRKTLTVLIIDDDLPGTISFRDDEMIAEQGNSNITIEIVVVRKRGTTGTVTCHYATEDGSAKAGTDYVHAQGTLTFGPKQSVQSFSVTIMGHGSYEKWELFRIILSNATGGACFDSSRDGDELTSILTVKIRPSEERKQLIDSLAANFFLYWDSTRLGNASWGAQCKSLLYVNGGDDDDDDDDPSSVPSSPSVLAYVQHAVLFPWKVVCAFIPPCEYCQGWLCFFVSLVNIGIVTAFVGDLARLFGCVVGLGDLITAITVVALGTSLPDTFASRTAAIKEPYADASIVNVTGSNSVNVYLGLGLPWMLAAFYWSAGPDDKWIRQYAGKSFVRDYKSAFVVKAGSLSFSVAVYVCLALFCFVILFVKRKLYHGELGGPKIVKIVTSSILATLWFLYIGLSIWYELK